MKETVNVSIASRAFTLDKDAWSLLDSYLDNIRSRIEPEDRETIDDIESRIADIFVENLPSPIMVVNASLVRKVMDQIGSPDIFGAPRSSGSNSDTPHNNTRNSVKQLRRSVNERVIAGVCGGIAQYMQCDPSVIRIITFIMVLCGGLSAWIYILLWLIIPESEQ